MFEFVLLANIVFPSEMNIPGVIKCAEEVGIELDTKEFEHVKYQDFLECRIKNNV